MSDSLKKPSNSLFCPERFAHSRSFVLSKLSKLLTFTHLSWVTWGIRLQSLICPKWTERISHICSFVLSDLSKWPMRKWANSQPYKKEPNLCTLHMSFSGIYKFLAGLPYRWWQHRPGWGWWYGRSCPHCPPSRWLAVHRHHSCRSAGCWLGRLCCPCPLWLLL